MRGGGDGPGPQVEHARPGGPCQRRPGPTGPVVQPPAGRARRHAARGAGRPAGGGPAPGRHRRAPAVARRARAHGVPDRRPRPSAVALSADERHRSRRRLRADLQRPAARRQRPPQSGHLRHHLDAADGGSAHGRDRRQEHDRQGRVPADRRDRGPLRQHDRQPLELAALRGGDRLLDHGVERSGDAGRPGPQVAVASAPAGRRQAHRPPQPGHRRQRAGLLGEVLPLLRCRSASGPRRGRPAPSDRRAGRASTATRTPSAWRLSSAPPSTAATSPSRRSPPPSISCSETPASTFRSTSTGRPAGSWPRSSSPTSNGTSGSRGSSRSTPPGTSTGWSTRASAGWCGATRTPSRRT